MSSHGPWITSVRLLRAVERESALLSLPAQFMSKEFNLSIRLSLEVKERLHSMAQRVGVPRELIVELAVEEFLEDPDLKELTQPARHPSEVDLSE